MRAAGSGQRGRRQLSSAQRGTVQAFIAVANLDHFDDDLLAAARAGEDCRFVVALTAQAALRDVIGCASVSNVVMRRPQQDVSRETSSRRTACRRTASRLPPSDPGSLLLRTLPHAPAFQPFSRPYGPVCIVSDVSSYDWLSNGFSKLLNALFFIGTTNYYGKI